MEFASVRRARQASEQYRTSPQTVAHFFYQDESRNDRPMPIYRFYTLPHDEAVRPVEKVLYNDGVALQSAFKAAAGVVGVEVWQGDRFVGVVHSGQSSLPTQTAKVDD